MKRRWVILKTGSTMPEIANQHGDFEQWIAANMGMDLLEFLVVPVVDGAMPPPPNEVHAVVITGSALMVTSRADWMTSAANWLKELSLANCPILGICFGHQLLGQALGGVVGANHAGREISTVRIHKSENGIDDPLLADLEPTFLAHTTHSEAVVKTPPNASLLATSAMCSCHAFRIRQTWGVQFHPEFNATIMRQYIRIRAQAIEAEGLNPEQLLHQVRDCTSGPTILQRFRNLANSS